MIKEIALLRDQVADITPQTLVVSDTAALILPVHQAVDHAREAMRGAGKIGTTGRGIGPAREDKVARRAVRLGDLASEETLRDKLAPTAHHNARLRAAGEDEPTWPRCWTGCWRSVTRSCPLPGRAGGC